jgi:hypothetical protein
MSRSHSEDGYNAGIAIKYKRGEFCIYLNIIYLYELSRAQADDSWVGLIVM